MPHHHVRTIDLGEGFGDMLVVVEKRGDPVKVTLLGKEFSLPYARAMTVSNAIRVAARDSHIPKVKA